MSGIQKIIAVVILLMSCAFVYASIDNYAKNDELKKQSAAAEQAQKAAEEREEAVKTESAQAATGKNQKIGELEQEKAVLESDKKRLIDEKGVLQGQNDTLLAEKATIAESLITATTTAEERGKTIDYLKVEVEKLRAETKTLADQLATAQKNAKDAKADLEAEQKARGEDNKKHEIVLAEKKDEIDTLKARLAGEKEVGEGLDVTCSVLSVSRNADLTLVSLNKGKEERLEPGVKLIVYNQAEEYKGTVEIISVQDGTSIAKIIDEVEGKKIAANDLATVKNW